MTPQEQTIYQDFVSQMKDYGLNEENALQLFESASILELPTRHILVNQGEEQSHLYFVSDGVCLASYLTSKGNTLSKEFFWGQEWVIDCGAVVKQTPSPYLLETLSPVTLICLPIECVQLWRETSHPLYVKLLEAQLIHKENKQSFALLYTPEERYQIISQQFPEMIERLSDTHLAAYLGITPDDLTLIKPDKS